MPRYMLEALVTVTAVTFVSAPNETAARRKALKRGVFLEGADGDAEEDWIVEDAGGTPRAIDSVVEQ